MHPTSDELKQLIQGELDEKSAESIWHHLDQCRPCDETLVNLEAQQDTVLSRLAKPAPVDFYADESNCHLMMERIALIGRTVSGAAVDNAAMSTVDSSRASVGGDTVGGSFPADSGQTADLPAIRDYKLIEKLGQGGMGAVYKAVHTKLRRVVALKLLSRDRMRDSSAIARFEREMAAVGLLDHPNIVRATDAGEHEGVHYLVMELVEGSDVAEIQAANHPLRHDDACEIIRQAAIGMQHAHESNLVHRDLKPSNLFLTRTGVVKILDLGLARLGEDDQVAGAEMTSTGQVMGTFHYMAPEQGSDSHSVDIRADVYSLGATLYKLLCGVAPFGDAKYDSPMKQLTALATQTPPLISERIEGIDADLASLVQKMISKEPSGRFANPAEVAQAINPFCSAANLVALHGDDAEASLPASIGRSAETTQPGAEGQVERDLRVRRCFVKIGLAMAGLIVVLMGVLFSIPTKDGTLLLSFPDGKPVPELTVTVTKDGKEVGVLSKRGKWSVKHSESGTFDLELNDPTGRFHLAKDSVSLERGGEFVFTLSFRSSAAAVPAPGNADSIQDGLVAHWKFDELKDGVAEDSSSNGHHLEVDELSLVEGIRGQAISLSGGSDIIRVPRLGECSSVTFTCFVRVVEVASIQHIFCNDDNSLSFRKKYNTGAELFLDNANVRSTIGRGEYLTADKQWHHVGMSIDCATGEFKLYRDGSLQAQAVIDSSDIRKITIGPGALGTSRNPGTKYDQAFTGQMDDVRFYDRVLTAQEMQTLSR